LSASGRKPGEVRFRCRERGRRIRRSSVERRSSSRCRATRFDATCGKYAGDTKQGRRDLLEANEHLSSFDKPVLVAWAAEDKVMPPEAGRRLAASFPDSRFVEIPGSRMLIPIDQPAAIADAIAGFASET
jgi:pimeloyl-ACP methyl ester carboxylesterase